MANTTATEAGQVHGTDPQYLIEKIVRTKIYESTYWKLHCFALTAESLVDKAVELNHVGGTVGGNRMPTPFLCLLLKMLQIQPEKEIVAEFIQNDDYKYVRVLGAMYLRMTGRAEEIYSYLEPLLNDLHRVRMRNSAGVYSITYVDEIIDSLLTAEHCFDIALPFLTPRRALEERGKLKGKPRVSLLDDVLLAEQQHGDGADADADAAEDGAASDADAGANANADGEAKGQSARAKSAGGSGDSAAPAAAAAAASSSSSSAAKCSRSRSRSRDRARRALNKSAAGSGSGSGSGTGAAAASSSSSSSAAAGSSDARRRRSSSRDRDADRHRTSRRSRSRSRSHSRERTRRRSRSRSVDRDRPSRRRDRSRSRSPQSKPSKRSPSPAKSKSK